MNLFSSAPTNFLGSNLGSSNNSDTSAAHMASTTPGTNTSGSNYGGVSNYYSAYGNYSPIGTTTAAAPNYAPAPPAPSYGNLNATLAAVRNKKAIQNAAKDFDALSASTLASGSQQAASAGNIYAQRELQAGINPVASGVVAAQAKLPVYDQLAQIKTQKDSTILDATNKADALAAQISQAIAGIQMSYTQTLADYNKSVAGYQLNLNEFNAGQQNQNRQFNASSSAQAAQLAAYIASIAKGTGSGSGSASATPVPPPYLKDLQAGMKKGYVGDSGSVSSGYLGNPNNTTDVVTAGNTWSGMHLY